MVEYSIDKNFSTATSARWKKDWALERIELQSHNGFV